MADITLYQFMRDTGVESSSPFCVKVQRLLSFKGLAYKTKNVGSPGELKRLNPNARKLPVIEYDGELIADSSRILDFIEEKHPDPPLRPSDSKIGALSRLLEDWADESLYWFAVYSRWAIESNFHAFAKRGFGRMPVPLKWIIPRVARRQAMSQLQGQGLGRLPLEQVLSNFDKHLTMLEGLLTDQPYLTGNTLSAGDIAVFAPLRATALETMPETAAIVRKHTPIVEWLQRVDGATKGEHTVDFE